MATTPSSEPKQSTYLPGHAPTQVQHHEWRTAQNSAAYLLPHLQKLYSAKPKLRLLDVGCGSGTISASLAALIPKGHVTATDISPSILSRAAEHAREKGVENISFQEASVFSLPFEDGEFDVVHASMVLSHLSHPVDAYREMLRVTAPPGGIVANRESDLRAWTYSPSPPGIAEFHNVLLAVHAASGGQIAAGPQLRSWALEAGAREESVEAGEGEWMFETPEEREMWGGAMIERIRGGAMREKAVEMGIASAEECDAMAEAWEEWVGSEGAWHRSLHGEIIIRK